MGAPLDRGYKGWAKRAKRYPRHPHFKKRWHTISDLIPWREPQYLRIYRRERLRLRLSRPMEKELWIVP